ncbi:hypothetical protein JG687_00001140 [Phytophthora cactorum]|uniref:Uncharacterized protein n=1 Tax=Phytophthora cactorum TaxID=29920 RepID=A0A329S9N7_9STRA|nr:hypothetical protein Pcac1_g13554 [Phytophthora cactorum]KAG3117367.1 hypothetical protein PI125_g3846 [Phytophthora idaei]KAG2840877.1 hypothetical protein PC112_g3590 [Phytophthora cactorum]KAG2842675.1 hypothetical protein PC111_g2647 [Phytophthora cactorum]KAG2867369.1 hypothetical protein PC113_g2034 [Phytophthora cactorum]
MTGLARLLLALAINVHVLAFTILVFGHFGVVREAEMARSHVCYTLREVVCREVEAQNVIELPAAAVK